MGLGREKVIAKARELYESDDIEIDNDALISETGKGRSCWVRAWLWIADDDFNEDLLACKQRGKQDLIDPEQDWDCGS